MNSLSLKQIDKIRQKGFRPEVVVCFLNEKKVLLLFKRRHNLWQLPQGGIDNKESAEDALVREMTEEMGNKFMDSCDKDFTLIGEDKIGFPLRTQESEELKMDQGKDSFMKGKKYFFYTINTRTQETNINETEFDDYVWLSYQEAKALTKLIYQRGKRRITIKALELLEGLELIS